MQETNTNDRFSLIELDSPTDPKVPAVPTVPEAARPIDMLDVKDPACVRCGGRKALDADGVCEDCFALAHAAPATATHAADTGRADRAVAQIKAHAAKVKAAQVAAKAAAEEGLAQARAEREAELARAVEVAPTTDSSRERLYHGHVVAGSAAEGHGILSHWAGERSLTVARVDEIGTRAGIDKEHLPKARKPETYAHAAVRQVAQQLGFYATKEKRDRLAADQDFDHKWRLQPLAQSGEAGESAGAIALVVTLKKGELTFASDATTKSSLAAEEIARVYAEMKGAEVLTAGQVTSWLGAYLRDQLSAVKYGGCWYVPQGTRAAAERVIESFATSGWGSDWMYPPTPIATSEQLARGVANGLAAEVEELHRFQEEDTARTTEKKLGERGARNYLARYKNKLARVKAFQLVLGEALVAEVKAKIEQKVATLETSLAGTDDNLGIAKRFELIWQEVEYDFAKGQGE